ncbi:NIPSNAP family protein [Aeromicrobium sp. 9AM]|uniref:NIPSNAP family protein n=1 Tax=Aeromicrobium sp. 9AM TaxID=2653126 RepID=UPI0012F0DE6F|nr:NIPSNAP family protein [Aeromicrobium sp. 9AM]VXC50651.1 conserved hypothetical protein [Aeromicrobium sp. 9AM]
MNDQVIELRQYTLKPGTRDGFIERFEREFQDTQEAVGIHVLGTFVDLDDADRFVWFRGFPTLEEHATSLAAFYGGPAWAAWGADANADLIDSDDVLLLRPRQGKPGLPVSVYGELAVRVWAIGSDADESSLVSAIDAGGGDVLLTHPGPNNFRLPVRDDRVVVALGGDGLPAGELQPLRLAPTPRSVLR